MHKASGKKGAIDSSTRAAKPVSKARHQPYSETEVRWAHLAACYDYADGVAAFIKTLCNLPRIPVCPTCNAPMRPNGVGSRFGMMEYHYVCATCKSKRTVIEIDRAMP